jgi:hypothetical protein
LTSW